MPLLGGWEMTGLARVTSGLPFGDQIGAGWVTSWYYQSFLVKTGPVKMHKHMIPGSRSRSLCRPDSLQSAVNSAVGSPVRYPFPARPERATHSGATGSSGSIRD